MSSHVFIQSPVLTIRSNTTYYQTNWSSRFVQLRRLQTHLRTSIILQHHSNHCGVSGCPNTQKLKYSLRSTCKTSTMSTTSCTFPLFQTCSPEHTPVSASQAQSPNPAAASSSSFSESSHALLTRGHTSTATAAYSLRARKLISRHRCG